MTYTADTVQVRRGYTSTIYKDGKFICIVPCVQAFAEAKRKAAEIIARIEARDAKG